MTNQEPLAVYGPDNREPPIPNNFWPLLFQMHPELVPKRKRYTRNWKMTKYIKTYLAAVGVLLLIDSLCLHVLGRPFTALANILAIAMIPAIFQHPFYQELWKDLTEL